MQTQAVRIAVAVLMLGAATTEGGERDSFASARNAVDRGIDYLASQQAQDGGWHSQHYGQLKAGPGVTALVLYAFSRCSDDARSRHPHFATNGYSFFKPGLQRRDSLAALDGTLDYPTYASALWLSGRAKLSPDLPRDENTEHRLVGYLLKAQIAEPRGFDDASPAYGGWDFLGADDAQGITTGTNVSLAAYILEALAAQKRDRQAIEVANRRARDWVVRTQQPDGGFAFTPEPASLNNKALFLDDEARTQPRSYGTATCDGIRALAALGEDQDHDRVQRAVTWLTERPSLEVVPGFEDLPAEADWQRGLRFYYYASLASASKHFPPVQRAACRQGLIELLVKEQLKDGKWANPSPKMHEDDPLIATSFALIALGELLEP